MAPAHRAGLWRWLLGCAVAAAALAVLTRIALSVTSMGDYIPGGPTLGDNAAPGLHFLLAGNLAGYAAHQPAIGLTSMLLRLPFAAIGQAFGSGELTSYQLGALACLLPLAALATWLVSSRWRGLAATLAAFVLVLSPVVRDALAIGHPEDVLTAALATAAVLAATGGHSRWAAVLLGLAVGAKPWGLIAAAPVLIAVPGRRLTTAALAGAIAAVLAGSAPLADPAAFGRALHGEGHTNLVNPLSLWWPLSASFHLPSGQLAEARMLPLGLSRSQVSMLGLAIVLPLLAMGGVRAVRRGASIDPLGLLVLLGLVRCACDSTHLGYYYLALLVPLTVWEVTRLRRPPILSTLGRLGVFLIPAGARLGDPTLLWAISAAATMLLGAYVAQRAFDADAEERAQARARARISPA